MARKGQLTPPVLPLNVVFKRAMEEIAIADEDVALFMVGGELRSTKRSSTAFENNIKRLVGGLIGVYNIGADARDVKQDIAEFYRGAN